MSVAYIGGTFDLLHYGHLRLFKRAKEEFNEVVVSLNRDEFIARFKLRSPVLTLNERMEMVAGCRDVDRVIVNFGDEDSKPALIAAGATHFIHGSEWKDASLYKQLGVTEEWLEARGITMVYYPYTTTISSSAIIKRILNGKSVGHAS